jgi:hypothetical protein
MPPMNLFVKAKDLGGAEHTIICDNAKRALEIEREKATGCEVWVEDGDGQRLDDAALSDLASQDPQALHKNQSKDEGAGERPTGSAST